MTAYKMKLVRSANVNTHKINSLKVNKLENHEKQEIKTKEIISGGMSCFQTRKQG